ncbi:MAG: Mut7-C ubiquitin/RNAse domain-containing protein [Verrucomicrobiota bacterium]|nr:Mut7-C ubiquitin/RNAse domain-containing protein [Verrucomicrobiota bacterium]
MSSTRLGERVAVDQPFTVTLSFRGNLNFFVKGRSEEPIVRLLKERSSVKDVIEACGVPHPEVDLILVDDRPVSFSFLLERNEHVDVYAAQFEPTLFPKHRLQTDRFERFVADGHLGKLAANLRLLGFDVAYNQNAQDRQLLELMAREDRALLTRDRRLLMHGIVQTGYFPRSQHGVEQTIEVIRRFDLPGLVAPFTRCLRCNALLEQVDKAEIVEKLEPLTKVYYATFRRCPGCGQIYWRGSHFDKLTARVEEIRTKLAVAA